MRALIVEDEPSIADAVRRGLLAEGFAVDVAVDGVDGLWKATSVEYDVVLLDVMLPGLTGQEVLRRMRAAEVWSPVLMLTAKDGDVDIVEALDLGADDYLTKPFSFGVLLARVRALSRRGASPRPLQLVAGDLALDPRARTCSRGGVSVELTAREFGLLHCLMSHLDEVLTKTELVAQVWDENFAGDLNIVEVYIGYLRRKIDLPFGRRAITTVRGAGYRLNGNGG